MTERITNAEVVLTHTSASGGSSKTVANFDSATRNGIETADVTRRVEFRRDQATIDLIDADGTILDFARPGDKVELKTQQEDEASLSTKFTGILQAIDAERRGSTTRLTLDCAGFVGWVLSHRIVTNGFADTQAAGTSSSVLDTIVSNNASELGLGGVESITQKLDINFRQTELLDACHQIADRTGSVLGSDGTDVQLVDIRDATPSTFVGEDSLTNVRYRLDGIGIVNDVRVDAGIGAGGPSPKQTTQSQLVTVTDDSTSWVTQAISFPKTRVVKAEVYLDPTGNDTDDAILRAQRDDGSGSPVELTNRDKDLARDKVPGGDIGASGFFTFDSFEGALPQDVVLIVESNGSSGVDVGQDSNGNLTYKLFYAFPLDITVENKNLIDKYRRREVNISNQDTQSQEAAEELASTRISRNGQPAKTIDAVADAPAVHDLQPLDVVEMSLDAINTTENYVVTEKRISLEGSRQTTNLRFSRKNSL